MSSGEFADSFGGGGGGTALDVSSGTIEGAIDKDGVAVVSEQELLVKPDSGIDIPEAIATAEEFQIVMGKIRAQFSGRMLDFVLNPDVKATKKALYAGMPKAKADSLLNDYFTDQFRN